MELKLLYLLQETRKLPPSSYKEVQPIINYILNLLQQLANISNQIPEIEKSVNYLKEAYVEEDEH